MTQFPAFPENGAQPEPAWPRYAIYYAPEPGSPLAEFGANWLGRDCATGEVRARCSVPGVTPERFTAITASARDYGFHATLKAPFTLAATRSEAELRDAAAGFAGATRAFPVRLALHGIGGFLVLMPLEPSPALHALADACVRAFQPYQAPLDEAELARRRRSPLTPRQDELLQAWGYPYVFDQFRFHMTLSARMADGPEREAFLAALTPLAAAATADPVPVDAIALFRQADRTAPFTLVERFGFQG